MFYLHLAIDLQSIRYNVSVQSYVIVIYYYY